MESRANLQVRLKVRSACPESDTEFEVVWAFILHPSSDKVLGMIITVNTQNDRLQYSKLEGMLLIPP